MKYIFTLTIILILTSQCFSQTKKPLYSLSAETPKTIHKDGKTLWTVKTKLTNKTKDTLFYFSTTCSEQGYYSIDTNALYIDFQKCNTDQQNVIKIAPKGSRTLDLEITSFKPVTASVPFRIVMFLFKAKDINDRMPIETLFKSKESMTFVWSDQLKT